LAQDALSFHKFERKNQIAGSVGVC
jgi:hypothetical protein